MTEQAIARVLADLADCLARSPSGPAEDTTPWQLAEPGRALDACLVRLPPGAEADPGAPPHDVLLVVLGGHGHLTTPDGREQLGTHMIAWLPKGSPRTLRASERGLVCLTVQVRRRLPAVSGAVTHEGGEPACLLDRVCPECGRLAPEGDAFCGRCGTALAA